MTKHVSSGDDKAQSSQRDAATESLPTQTGTDDDAQALSQGAADGHPVEPMAPDVAADAVVDAASGADRRSERNDARGNQTAPAATASAVRAAAAANSTADTRLAGAWASPDAQNAATIGVAGSASDSAKKARAKARGPWYRRRAVVGVAGVVLLAGPHKSAMSPAWFLGTLAAVLLGVAAVEIASLAAARSPTVESGADGE